MMAPSSGPVRERIGTLDVLRGVAVGGILLANVLVFFGVHLLPADRAAALPTATADRVAAFLEHVLVEGKFYSIFSLLFGIGFGLQLTRGGDAAVPRFRRRLRILLAIGAVHAVLLWAGDILMLYALLGFTMPWFAAPVRSRVAALDRRTPRPADGPLSDRTRPLEPVRTRTRRLADAGSRGMPPEIMARLAAVGTGGVGDAFIGNLLFLAGRWTDLFASVRFPKVLGMFVLGTLDRAPRHRARPGRRIGDTLRSLAPDRLGHRPAVQCRGRVGVQSSGTICLRQSVACSVSPVRPSGFRCWHWATRRRLRSRSPTAAGCSRISRQSGEWPSPTT